MVAAVDNRPGTPTDSGHAVGGAGNAGNAEVGCVGAREGWGLGEEEGKWELWLRRKVNRECMWRERVQGWRVEGAVRLGFRVWSSGFRV